MAKHLPRTPAADSTKSRPCYKYRKRVEGAALDVPASVLYVDGVIGMQPVYVRIPAILIAHVDRMNGYLKALGMRSSSIVGLTQGAIIYAINLLNNAWADPTAVAQILLDARKEYFDRVQKQLDSGQKPLDLLRLGKE